MGCQPRDSHESSAPPGEAGQQARSDVGGLAVGAHAGDSRKQLGVLLDGGDGALEVRGVLEQLHELHGVVRHVRHVRRHLVRLQPTDPRVSKAWRVQTQAVHLR